METSAPFEARSAPLLYPTAGCASTVRGATGNRCLYRDPDRNNIEGERTNQRTQADLLGVMSPIAVSGQVPAFAPKSFVNDADRPRLSLEHPQPDRAKRFRRRW
jgi:hypothetical protein